MDNLNKYRLARKDIGFNQAPYRDNGTFKFTPGLEKIMGQERYKEVRILTKDIESLEVEQENLLKEMRHYRDTYENIDKSYGERISKYQIELQRIEEELALKEADLERHMEDMAKRDIILQDEAPDQEMVEEKEPKVRKKKWLLPVAMFFMYLVIEAFTYVTQIDSLRDVKSYEEIGSRVLAMFVLILLFHIVAHMARKSRKLIYSIAMGFYLLMIGIMMFAPTALHYIYPEPSQTADASIWSLDENTPSVDNNANSTIPGWVELYRKMEWAPAGLGILIFLIVFFVVPNPFFSKKEEDKSVTPENDHENNSTEMDDRAWAMSRWKQLKREVHSLRTKKGMVEAQIQQQKSNAEDLLPLQDKLESLEQKIKAIDESIRSKELELEEFLKALEAEINEYRAEYEDILSGDEVKQAILKPEWPGTKDIINHFKVS